MKRFLILCVVACLAIPSFAADDDDKDPNKAEDRIKAAGTVLDEIESAPDQGIPEEVSRISPMRGCSAHHAERRIHRWSPFWTRRGQLPYPEGLECSRIFHH